ncbi:hypothetical protein OUZ56_027643 [Daphnia magna]|uniref:Uncharacterized protein n=1 Tax=Daphnia magna TaxID=35525 RepID=A0ABR0B1H8_9CRUS|nr:hypothetical protein OUZ56_027643 [Daphnia magna]
MIENKRSAYKTISWEEFFFFQFLSCRVTEKNIKEKMLMVYSHPGSKSAFKKKKKEWERKTFWFSRENKILVHLSVAGFKTINVNFVWMALSLYRFV